MRHGYHGGYHGHYHHGYYGRRYYYGPRYYDGPRYYRPGCIPALGLLSGDFCDGY